jgi:hypothetical protein
MPLNVSLFFFMTKFNSNWLICVGVHKPESLFIIIRFLTILLKTLKIMKYLKHLRAKDGHHSNVEHSELIDSV